MGCLGLCEPGKHSTSHNSVSLGALTPLRAQASVAITNWASAHPLLLLILALLLVLLLPVVVVLLLLLAAQQAAEDDANGP